MKAEIDAPSDVDSDQRVEQKIKEWAGDPPWSFLAGPIFLLCTLAIASWLDHQELFYWLSLAIIGMAFSVFYRMRGFVYATLFLLAASLLKSGSLFDQKLLHLGLEGSLACSFFITALSTDQRKSVMQSLQEKTGAQELTIGNLEQNLSKVMESSQSQQISFQEKIALKQKELEEAQAELSSILVLNEVLRKTTAAQLKESQQRADSLIDRERRLAFLISERDQLQQQLDLLKNDSQLSLEKERLQEEINQIRCDYAQLELLHENLSHSYQQKAQIAAETKKAFEEIFLEKESLQEKTNSLESENAFLKQDVERLSEQLSGSFASQQALEQWEAERNCWQERLQEKDRESIAQMAQIEHLEKEAGELKGSLEAQLQKIHSQQQDLDDLHSELSSLSTLNETLRDTLEGQAEEFQEKEQALKDVSLEKGHLEAQLEQFRNESLLVQENAKLSEELTSQGYQLTEMKKAYDNLEYLYEKQVRHSEEIHHNLCAFSTEKQALQQEIGSLKATNQMLKAHVEKLSEELSKSSVSLKNLEQFRNERNFLQERLQAAELQITAFSQKIQPTASSAKENPALLAEREALLSKLADREEKLALLDERLKKATQVEALYQQLRTQFEEKNQVLQETRSQLFLADTELQKLRIEKAQKEIEADPFAAEMQNVVKGLEEEIRELQQENSQLQEMISQLFKQE